MANYGLKYNIFGLLVRMGVFGFVLAMYVDGTDLMELWQQPLNEKIGATQALWLIMMAGMAVQLAPVRPSAPSSGAARVYDAHRLALEVNKMNHGAKKTMAFWLFINGTVAALYFTGLISGSEVILIASVYYLCDSFCMLFWCPLQKLFTKSLCCSNCRIFGWGYFFVFGIFFLLPGFLTISLAAMSVVLLIRWEVYFTRHPEWFWAGSNASLRCGNCTSKSCAIKNHLSKTMDQRTDRP